VLTWGNDSIAAAADTRFLTPGRGGTAVTTVTTDINQLPAPRAGLLQNFFVRHNSTSGNGNNVVYTVLVNGAATAITVTLATGAIGQASDTVHTVVIAQGDRISIRAVKAVSIGGAGDVDVQTSLEM
jgi:hypothetical protein